MTGRKMITRALSLLGFAENDGNLQLTQRVMNRALPLVNLVYGDLHAICGTEEYKPLENLNDKISLPIKALDIFACGLAGYIAGSESDDYMQSIWMAEYQQRRVTLSRVTEYKDVLPKIY